MKGRSTNILERLSTGRVKLKKQMVTSETLDNVLVPDSRPKAEPDVDMDDSKQEKKELQQEAQ